MVERLQKLLSAAGVCSRRKAEEYIAAGRITVNGRPAVLGERVDTEKDEVAFDGRVVSAPDAVTVLMLNKPRGYVTTLSDEKGRKTVADLLQDCPVRVWPVGRLDRDSEGLLLLTNDGDLTNALIHPSREIEKEYRVRVTGFRGGEVEQLSRPMTLDGQALRPAKVRLLDRSGDRALLSVVIHEGKNRQIRRMCASCGLSVARLKRVREGGLPLDGGLKPGQWRPLTGEELALLRRETFLQD